MVCDLTLAMKQNLKKLFTKRQGKLIMVCNDGSHRELAAQPFIRSHLPHWGSTMELHPDP